MTTQPENKDKAEQSKDELTAQEIASVSGGAYVSNCPAPPAPPIPIPYPNLSGSKP